MHARVHACMAVCIYLYVYVYVYVYVCVSVCVYISVCVFVCVSLSLCVCYALGQNCKGGRCRGGVSCRGEIRSAVVSDMHLGFIQLPFGTRRKTCLSSFSKLGTLS